MLISLSLSNRKVSVFIFSLFLGILFSSQVFVEDYTKFVEGSIVIKEVQNQLTFSERRDLVSHILAVAENGYLPSKGMLENMDGEATFEDINRYLPITIIRTTDPDMFAGMPFVTPEDLEEIAGSKISLLLLS